jgi:hypothetical protein
MEDKNLVDGRDIPMGLGMALAQNLNAMNYFSNLDHGRQREIINETHQIRSKEEMKDFVSHMSDRDSFR